MAAYFNHETRLSVPHCGADNLVSAKVANIFVEFMGREFRR